MNLNVLTLVEEKRPIKVEVPAGWMCQLRLYVDGEETLGGAFLKDEADAAFSVASSDGVNWSGQVSLDWRKHNQHRKIGPHEWFTSDAEARTQLLTQSLAVVSEWVGMADEERERIGRLKGRLEALLDAEIDLKEGL